MLIITNSGKRVTVEHDVDFVDLLRETVSQDAADFYENRVTELITSVEETLRILKDDTGRYDPIDAIAELEATLKYQGWDV